MKSKLNFTLGAGGGNSEENCETRGSTHNPETAQIFKEILYERLNTAKFIYLKSRLSAV